MKIIIEGTPAEGKTTVAILVAEALRNAGFTVKETDDDIVNGHSYPNLQANRLLAIAKTITVETVQKKYEEDSK